MPDKNTRKINLLGGLDRIIIIISIVFGLISAWHFIDPIQDALLKDNPEYIKWVKEGQKPLSEKEISENYKKTRFFSTTGVSPKINPPAGLVFSLSFVGGVAVFYFSLITLKYSIRIVIFLYQWVYDGFKS